MTQPAPPSQPAAAPIAVVQGGDGLSVQACLAGFVRRHRERSRIVGVVEEFDAGASGGERASRLACVRGTARFELFQDLGPAATACALFPQGLVDAGEHVRRQIAQGCDLVVLSKFGKLEADAGSGLVAAFVEALSAGVPVLTSVSPRYIEAWTRFAETLFVTLPLEPAAIDGWWHAARQAATPPLA